MKELPLSPNNRALLRALSHAHNTTGDVMLHEAECSHEDDGAMSREARRIAEAAVARGHHRLALSLLDIVEAAEQTQSAPSEVAAVKLQEKLQHLASDLFVGVGWGSTEAVELIVYVTKAPRAASVPLNFLGYPVRVEATGGVTPTNAEGAG